MPGCRGLAEQAPRGNLWAMVAFRLITMVALAAAALVGQGKPTTEFGTIAWQRDFEAATAVAKKAKKPMLLLFQEVPG